ncbi:hypothetical protein HTG_18980 [Natrinema mahii]|nr:hypothetical protein HTG_18980 [Natrinema mahii]
MDQFEDLYGNDGLGRYRHMAFVLDLFDQYQGTLKTVVEYRNNLAHDYGYLDTLQTNPDEREAVESVLEDTVEFIDQVEL